MEIKIRQAKIKDLDSILKLSLELFKFERKFGKTFNMNWTYSDVGKNYFSERLKNENAIVLIAEDEKKVVGYLCCFSQNYKARSINPIAEVENMFIEEKYRHSGIGKMLIKELKNRLKKRNVKRMKVGALYQNEKAISFYKSVGFEEFELVLEQNLK